MECLHSQASVPSWCAEWSYHDIRQVSVTVSLILTGQVKAVTAMYQHTATTNYSGSFLAVWVGWCSRCVDVSESTLKTTYNLTLINFVIPTYRLTVPHIRWFASSLWECNCLTTICQKSLLYTITLSAMYFWGINMFIIITTPTTITWNQF